MEAQGKIKVTTVKPTGVLGTNQPAAWSTRPRSWAWPVRRASNSPRTWAIFLQRTLRPQTDPDSVQYWLITPDELAEAVVHVIDQPWGISISDITVRASGENYIR